MADSEFSDDDLRELHAVLQSSALEAFPNPERIGCPSSQVLVQVAAAKFPSDHPGYQHVATCSPCLKEMLELRARRFEYKAAQRKKWMGLLIAAAAAIVLLSFGMYWLSVNRRLTTEPRQIEVAFNDRNLPPAQVGFLDFRNNSGQRGTNANTSEVPSVRANTKELILRLPHAREDVKYELEIRDSSTMNPEVHASQTMMSKAADGTLILKAIIDLSKLPPGPHIAAWRPLNATTWDLGSFEIK